MSSLIAQSIPKHIDDPLQPLEGIGPLGLEGEVKNIINAVGRFNQVISMIVGLITVIAGLWFVFQFIIGAINWLTAGGDKAKLQEAQKKITNALIGLVVVIIAIFIIDLVGAIMGLDILSPGNFILNLWS